MSDLPAWLLPLLAARRLTPQAVGVWVVLRLTAGADETPGVFSPPACRLSDAARQRALGGYSRSQVSRWLAELIAAGLVQRVTHAGQRWLQLCVPAAVSPVTHAAAVSPMTPGAAVSPVEQTLAVSPAAQVAAVPPVGQSPAASLTTQIAAVSPATQPSYPPVDYPRLTDVSPAPDPQRAAARVLWATLLPHLPAAFADTVGLELAQSSAGLPVLIVGVPAAARARALDAGQADTALEAALRAAGFPVRAVRFVSTG